MHHRSRLFSAFMLASMLLPGAVLAQAPGGFVGGIQQGVNTAGAPAGFQAGGPTLEVIIGNVIGTALSLVGVLLIIILIYAGFLYMTAGGATEKIKTAKGLIINSIIGLIIVTASYAIATFVLTNVAGGTQGGGGVANTSPAP